MKKTVLFFFLLSLHAIAFAQHKPVIVTSEMFHPTDTTRTFAVRDMDQDLCIKKLIDYLGIPAINTTGNMVWNQVSIKTLDNYLKLEIRDGIMTYDKKTGTACWKIFDSEADKQQKLAALASGQYRDMKIEITDQQGKNVIDSNEKELAAKKFLAGLLEKD